MNSLFRCSSTLSLGVGFLVFATANAPAEIVSFTPNASFSSAPYTITFSDKTETATYTFSYIPDNDGVTVDQVSTGGTGQINAFFSEPLPYDPGSLIGDNGYTDFTSFPSPAPIMYSVSEDSIGFAFQLADGLHYGYVTTFGPTVLQYGYNTVPGGFIATGATVPEPSTWIMLGIGFAALGARLRGALYSTICL